MPRRRIQDKTIYSYDLDPKYQLFNAQQLERIRELTARAAVLKRSLITQSYLENGLDVRSKSTSNQIKTFILTPEIEGNRDKTIDLLERAVQYAQIIEKDTRNKVLFATQGYSDKGDAIKNTKQVFDRFRTKKIMV